MLGGGIRLRQFQDHSRHWRDNHYVYPVISRRSRGLSIGINLNPDTACNFDCVYCQVDRTSPPRVRSVDPSRVRDELAALIDTATSGALFEDAAFADVPESLRRINDIAFSGDGEPTTCPHFTECVRITADLKRKAGLAGVKIVLITDACYLTRPAVQGGLDVMDANNGEIWAKLDAGTNEYFQRVNRPNVPLDHVIENIVEAARTRSVVIQSLFMRLSGEPPALDEVYAYVDRLREIQVAGGKIRQVQIYTVSRAPAEAFVSPLRDEEVDDIVRCVEERTGLHCAAFYAGAVS